VELAGRRNPGTVNENDLNNNFSKFLYRLLVYVTGYTKCIREKCREKTIKNSISSVIGGLRHTAGQTQTSGGLHSILAKKSS
jgi:hypothetical protein